MNNEQRTAAVHRSGGSLISVQSRGAEIALQIRRDYVTLREKLRVSAAKIY
jgi:hypothetical protein